MRRSVLLLLLVGWACARQGAIPGGPPDRVAPIVVETVPEPMAMLEEWDDPVLIRFNERISERATGGTLEDVVLVSPAVEDVEVKHRRDGLEISAPGGFPAGRVYRFTVQTMISDLFGNTLREPFELVFSTGPEPIPTVVAGSVTDRLTGQPQALRVDAVSEEDEEVYPSRSDSEGIFALRFLPAGRYVLRAFEDRNRNAEPDFGEPQAQTTALLGAAGDTAIYELETLAGDSTAARLLSVTVTDSVTLEVTFDDYMDPDVPLNTVNVTLAVGTDSTDVATPVQVPLPTEFQVLHPFQREALLRDRAAAADTSSNVPQGRVPVSPLAGPGGAGGSQDPLPQQSLFVVAATPLPPGVPLELELTGVLNIHRIPLGGGSASLMREVVVDTTSVPDTLTPADSTNASNLLVPPDTVGPPDTLTPPDTVRMGGGRR